MKRSHSATWREEEELAEPVAYLLNNLVQAARAQAAQCPNQAPHPLSAAFEGKKRIAVLTLDRYMARLARYSGCTRATTVAALIYIDRLLALHPDFDVNEGNIHRLLFTALVLSLKFFEDNFYSNQFYGQVGGVTTQELNALEVSLLMLLQCNLYITGTLYEKYDRGLTTAIVYCDKQKDAALTQRKVEANAKMLERLREQKDSPRVTDAAARAQREQELLLRQSQSRAAVTRNSRRADADSISAGRSLLRSAGERQHEDVTTLMLRRQREEAAVIALAEKQREEVVTTQAVLMRQRSAQLQRQREEASAAALAKQREEMEEQQRLRDESSIVVLQRQREELTSVMRQRKLKHAAAKAAAVAAVASLPQGPFVGTTAGGIGGALTRSPRATTASTGLPRSSSPGGRSRSQSLSLHNRSPRANPNTGLPRSPTSNPAAALASAAVAALPVTMAEPRSPGAHVPHRSPSPTSHPSSATHSPSSHATRSPRAPTAGVRSSSPKPHSRSSSSKPAGTSLVSSGFATVAPSVSPVRNNVSPTL
eukprot:TRINITY_DN18310_c0_g1_i1.p1 TRINITY_DN18310_c0_g1~~TRINITY_DN18310_c0_g1_i1.p1  ORF type:complete len:538 (-),score=119.16 TRINITY_DN18310_c0_g1_i1:77-1690(-)